MRIKPVLVLAVAGLGVHLWAQNTTLGAAGTDPCDGMGIRYVRYNAALHGISLEPIAAFGFSAGGHPASTIAIHFGSNFNLSTEDGVDQTDARPDFPGLGYPVISMDPAQYASKLSFDHLPFHNWPGERGLITLAWKRVPVLQNAGSVR